MTKESASGADAFADDESILPADTVYRRVRADKVNIVFDKSLNRDRPSSAAFEEDEDGMSVHLGSVIDELGLDPSAVLHGHSGYRLASLSVEFVRAQGLRIRRDHREQTEADPCGPAHCLVKGQPGWSIGQQDKVRKRLAKSALLLTY